MKPIRTIIVDDESFGIEVIKELISHLANDLEIIGTATDGRSALQMIITLEPDLVFLDVDMPYMNGIEVLQKLPKRSIQIIFTTGFEPRELKSVTEKSYDYLSKPIDPEDFLIAVEKARRAVQGKNA
jgi:two-component system LytT family response regulator